MGTELQLNAGETEMKSASASRAGWCWSSGGKLVLTNQRLLFCRLDNAKIKWACELSDITYVGLAHHLNVFASMPGMAVPRRPAVKVVLKNGDSQRFVLPEAAEWVPALNETLAKLSWEWRTILR